MAVPVLWGCGRPLLPRNQSMNLAKVKMKCLPLQRGGRMTRPNLYFASTVHFGHSISLPQISSLPRIAPFSMRCCAATPDFTAGRGRMTESPTGGLLRVALLIASATAVSKLLGLIRETVLAGVFGVGPVINAFSYASVLPGFFLTLLGGINGPFHSAVAASLSKRPKEEGGVLLQRLTLITVLVFGAISVMIFFLAGPIVNAIAPGLSVPGYRDGFLTRNLAVVQLKIMAPCAVLAALVGIGFGALSSAGVYGVLSLSPALSSISILVAVGAYVSWSQKICSASLNVAAAVALAVGATTGAFSQWALLALAKQKAGFGRLQFSMELWNNLLGDQGVHEVFAVLLPAVFASGMLQIATYTDLYFASFIPGAAAALGYANLLAMAPLGILSSSMLVPLLPKLSRLSTPSCNHGLPEFVRQGLLLSMVMTTFMTAMIVSLAGPIVRIIFERHAFDASDSALVSSLLICYVLGSTFYLARDFLVHVYYALGDGQLPFKVSIGAICANAFLDWLLVRHAGCGVHGLVLATSLVNCGSAVLLYICLSKRIQGLQLQNWVKPLLSLGCRAAAAGVLSKFLYDQLLSLFITLGTVNISMLWYQPEHVQKGCSGFFRNYWVAEVLSVIVAGGVGMIVYFIPLLIFPDSDMKAVLQLMQIQV